MMNLKYYLRGLGIGIIVTALIMNIAAGRKETLTNEEIKERAKALGMVEEGTLLEDAQAALNTLGNSGTSSSEESEDVQKLTGDGALEETPSPSGNETSEEESKPSENETPEEIPKQSESEETEGTPQQSEDDGESEVIIETEGIWPSDEDRTEGENITVQVRKGEGSYTVCKRLEEAGIISSASEFDTFLCQNGYDKKIRAGTFEIPTSAGQEEIARILVGAQ